MKTLDNSAGVSYPDPAGYAEQKCFERVPATPERPWGGHELTSLSHEEEMCSCCGAVFFTPDL